MFSNPEIYDPFGTLADALRLSIRQIWKGIMPSRTFPSNKFQSSFERFWSLSLDIVVGIQFVGGMKNRDRPYSLILCSTLIA
ncbi:MAG: hypothetical protein EZS28_027238 [Streblomastix strix]|uniref:Uncharacterized protein n=1 Tax=Streblomastix strix TaxID=222440 RepID=A0A5J4V2R3_9EUKA|nr:MAG: hypothetical protein EZS28_027238 [Streblomastix strix]